jgi:hypothetical protein
LAFDMSGQKAAGFACSVLVALLQSPFRFELLLVQKQCLAALGVVANAGSRR